ncbi:MAG: winged helix-turn-helix transcriptional regulator [Gammaproteobacteria bacterium]|nr:winged helix-turn-helix transcriptional regulator [Gammaproteobacteria bacterium]MBI5615227.1 winged helix-turn-helix transcriptional regulator [Gammaproteobacteria bacterium]
MKLDREESLTLELLQQIEARSDITQRHLADRLGVALGLANYCLRRSVRKGLVKITQAPANRYLYYLTPKGFAEKSRLTAEFLSAQFAFYRQASGAMEAAFAACRERGAARVLFGGVSELAEIGSVRAADFELELIGTFDPDSAQSRFVGRPVWTRLLDVGAADAAIFTKLAPHDGLYTNLVDYFGPARVIVPGIVRPLAALPEADDGDGASQDLALETSEKN